MDFDSIAIFVKVVESGSFSAAARLLQIPKTTVSAKIAALEKRLGVTLIQRTTRKLNITEAGQTYYRHCAVAVREVELGESQILASQENPTGVLKITAPPDVGHSILPKIVDRFLSEHPDVQIELIVTNRFVDLIGESVDLGIRAGELKDSTLVAKKFFDIESGLWASSQYLKKFGEPTHPKDLVKHQMIAMSVMKGEAGRVTDGTQSFDVWANPKIRIDDAETIRAFVTSHQGIGWLPNFIAHSDSTAKKIHQILPSWKFIAKFSFWFVYPGQKFASAKVRAFIDVAMKVIEGGKFC